MIDIEKEKEQFKDHVATFTDYGNIKILDFANPNTSYYRIRFLFEEDFCKLHISGDLGELIATNYNNMRYETFSDFVNSIGYFREKVNCHNREFYYYDYNKAKCDLYEYLRDCEIEPDDETQTAEEYLEEKIEEILEELDIDTGLNQNAYDMLSEIDPDCFDYISHVGKVSSGILEVYMLAFKLAQEQLANTKKEQE